MKMSAANLTEAQDYSGLGAFSLHETTATRAQVLRTERGAESIFSR